MKKIIAIIAIVLLVSSSAWAGPKITRGGGSAAGTGSVATDTIWDAAGDILYGTGSNTGDSLAIGTAYQLLMTNSGATAPAWTSTLGATGTRMTAGFFTDLTVTNAIAGSTTGNIANTLLDATGSMVYASGANTPAKLAAGTAGYVLKMGASVPEWSNSLSVLIDNSAAQFKDATDATKLVKIDPVGMTTGKTLTVKESFDQSATLELKNTGLSADSKTITLDLACTDDCTITGPAATGTLAILGANTFTGNQTLDDGTGASPTLTFQDATNETAIFEKADAGFLTITTAAGDGVNVVTGNFKVGNGSPTKTQDGEDAYVEGMLEVDGVIYADGGITGATASDPYIKLDETDGTDWWIGIDDTGNSLEFRTNVAVGNTVRMELYESTGLLVTPPAAQTIEAGNTIAANACGTIKIITSAGDVTTDTTNTFTAPAATNAGCCMDVINTGANTITLDVNTNFVSAGAANVALGAGDTVRVCSTGASGKWYQIGATGNN